jgi:ArsR family transcriptional regulator, arsenate/arsenite/antimonite-responsive transcriptional repressor
MTDQEFHRIAKVLADPRRFRVLQRIVAGNSEEVSCQLLLKEIPIAPATMSHHLKELETAGLVESRFDGQSKFMLARTDMIQGYERELGRRLGTKR